MTLDKFLSKYKTYGSFLDLDGNVWTMRPTNDDCSLELAGPRIIGRELWPYVSMRLTPITEKDEVASIERWVNVYERYWDCQTYPTEQIALEHVVDDYGELVATVKLSGRFVASKGFAPPSKVVDTQSDKISVSIPFMSVNLIIKCGVAYWGVDKSTFESLRLSDGRYRVFIWAEK